MEEQKNPLSTPKSNKLQPKLEVNPSQVTIVDITDNPDTLNLRRFPVIAPVSKFKVLVVPLDISVLTCWCHNLFLRSTPSAENGRSKSYSSLVRKYLGKSPQIHLGRVGITNHGMPILFDSEFRSCRISTSCNFPRSKIVKITGPRCCPGLFHLFLCT